MTRITLTPTLTQVMDTGLKNEAADVRLALEQAAKLRHPRLVRVLGACMEQRTSVLLFTELLPEVCLPDPYPTGGRLGTARVGGFRYRIDRGAAAGTAAGWSTRRCLVLPAGRLRAR